MAIDAYMTFKEYPDEFLEAESQVKLVGQLGEPEAGKIFQAALAKKAVFEIEDYSFDIEQTLNIGSQSTGAGAGRVTFNPFSITRKIDKLSPVFFQKACSGTAFKEVCLGLRKSAGGDASGQFFVLFRFLLVAVKTVSWAHDDEAPKETVTFEYGALQVFYGQQKPDGSITQTTKAGGWNRVKNVADPDPKSYIV